MNETLICKLNKHNIYYLSNNYMGFYILAPYKDYIETNITIRLKSNYEMYNLNKYDINIVQNELLNYYKNIDNYNITLILPVFFDDILDRIRVVNDIELYHTMDKLLGIIFNEAYGFLTKNNVKVNSNIYFINNDSFKTFTNWYVSRYNNRIEYKTVLDLVKENGSYHSYNIVETPNMNFVVGKENDPKIDTTFEVEVETFDNMVKNIDKKEKIEKARKEEDEEIVEKVESSSNAGFVSYIVLGIITFIVSFGLLFVFIK